MNEHVFNNTCTAIRCKCIYIYTIYIIYYIYIKHIKNIYHIHYTQGTVRGYPGLSSQVGGCTKKALRCENSSSRKCYAAPCGKPFNSKSPLIATIFSPRCTATTQEPHPLGCLETWDLCRDFPQLEIVWRWHSGTQTFACLRTRILKMRICLSGSLEAARSSHLRQSLMLETVRISNSQQRTLHNRDFGNSKFELWKSSKETVLSFKPRLKNVCFKLCHFQFPGKNNKIFENKAERWQICICAYMCKYCTHANFK